MATGGENRHEDSSGSDDLYGVLGVNKQCTDAELKIAYRRLAMTWHPDRCSAPGSSTRMEEAKERFQEIQGAYSVLSDSNKRFLYDFGVYDSEEDDQDLSGMGDFLGEMAEMMSQATPTDTFEELQQLFVDMFHADLDSGFCGGPHTGQKVQSPPCASRSPRPPSPASTRTPPSCKGTNKRCSPATAGSWNQPSPGCPGSGPGLDLPGSCLKGSDRRRREAPRTKDGRSGTKRQRVSTNHMQSGISHSQQRTTVFSLSP